MSQTPDIHVYPTGWIEFHADITPSHRSKLVRELTAIKGPTPPEWPSGRLPRPYTAPKSPRLDDFRRVASRGVGDRESAAVGCAVGPDHVIDVTNGHVAILAPGTRAEGKREYMQLYVPPDAPRRIVIDADFWAAYSRVRTCRHGRSKSVTIGQATDATWIEAGDLDNEGWYAKETVRETDPRGVAPCELFELKFDDRYLWPLRGLTGTVRQAGEGKTTWWQLDGCPPILIMPMVTWHRTSAR